MKPGGPNKTHNRLWLIRKRCGLRQKQVAALLNHRTIDQISRYEKSLRIPNLETALKLEIIYGTPLRMLFKHLYEQLQEEIRQKIESNYSLKQSHGTTQREEDGERDYCTYSDILGSPFPSPAELTQVRRHITRLAKKLAYL